MGSRLRMPLFLLLLKSILCFSAASRYGYQIPSTKSPPPPFLDLEILHNNFDNLEEILNVPFNKYRNQFQADTQRILGAIVAEVLKMESAYQDPKHLHWRKFVKKASFSLLILATSSTARVNFMLARQEIQEKYSQTFSTTFIR